MQQIWLKENATRKCITRRIVKVSVNLQKKSDAATPISAKRKTIHAPYSCRMKVLEGEAKKRDSFTPASSKQSYHDDQGKCMHMIQVAKVEMHVIDQASLMVATELANIYTLVGVVPHTFALL